MTLAILLGVAWGCAWFLTRSAAGEALVRRPVAVVGQVGKDSTHRGVRWLTAPFRAVEGALECPACAGWWAGVFGWCLLPQSLRSSALPWTGQSLFATACAFGALSMGINALLGKTLDVLTQAESLLWRRQQAPALPEGLLATLREGSPEAPAPLDPALMSLMPEVMRRAAVLGQMAAETGTDLSSAAVAAIVARIVREVAAEAGVTVPPGLDAMAESWGRAVEASMPKSPAEPEPAPGERHLSVVPPTEKPE